MFCELFFRSSSFPARVRAQVHVRSDLDASAVSPLFLFGPFPPFSGPFGGVRFALCQDSLQFVTARALEFLESSSCLSPFVFLAFQVPRRSGLLLPLVFCRQAYGPCLSSSFRLAPFALASPAPAQHGFLHSSWLSSVLALVSLSAP